MELKEVNAATLKRDPITGRLLCPTCWNGTHFGKIKSRAGKPTNKRFSRCLQGGCECLCRELLAEQETKRKQKVVA